MIENTITSDIIGCAIDIHREFGPELLESAYREFLCYDLIQKGYIIEKEKSLPVIYKGVRQQIGYRMDIVVENTVVIELKTCRKDQ